MNGIDIYVNRKKLIAALILGTLNILFLIGMSAFCWTFMVIVIIKKQSFIPLLFAIPALFFAFLSFIVGFPVLQTWYTFLSKKPFLHIDSTGITRFVGPHALHIPWSNIAHINLATYPAHFIAVHITDKSLLDKNAHMLTKPLFFQHVIGFGNIATIPLNKIFVLLQEYKKINY